MPKKKTVELSQMNVAVIDIALVKYHNSVELAMRRKAIRAGSKFYDGAATDAATLDEIREARYLIGTVG